ncbi:hypothetical protein ACZ87_01857 [Candidatus Erwinia dacicola]|uniref:Uncharacterized protein n=1 Tax=Candidatus Erwinia dacicola TaxID=252393 RepID=A0A328TLL8_9GAMM|nr:hypothetical protein ACZ87_01857 [Candidatus Erwinia dacicola]
MPGNYVVDVHGKTVFPRKQMRQRFCLALLLEFAGCHAAAGSHRSGALLNK